MGYSTQEGVPSDLYPLKNIRLPSAPPSSYNPMNTTPPPVYGSHGFDTLFSAPTNTATEGNRRSTESETFTQPPRQKKHYCIAALLTILGLCILVVTVLNIIDCVALSHEGTSSNTVD